VEARIDTYGGEGRSRPRARVGRSTDGRAQKTRPRTETEFLDRWGALAEIEDGIRVTNTQRLEPCDSGQSP
jgi:hypothetical protein